VAANAASDLYGLPLDRFVPERGALAKALRGEGDKDAAARVAALRKPSVAAWTVNQLVRTQPAAVTTLFDAGVDLRSAQSELLAGRGDAGALREAAQAERRAVDDLAEIARGLLSSEGHEPTRATLDRVSETLHAAALDDDSRARVSDGCLDRELRQVGFGAGGAKAEHERASAERAEHLKSARRAVAAARRHAELTARQLHTAEERRDRAAGSLNEAEEGLAAARARAEEAELAHQRAQEELEGV
jgi:hypothetical protein